MLFEHAVAGVHTELLHTPYRTPKANAVCERFLGSVRREGLDHVLVFGEGHARPVVGEYITFFNHSRPHQRIDQQLPELWPLPPPPDEEHQQVTGLPVLHGL